MGNQDTHAARAYHDGTKHPDGALFDPAHSYTNAMRPLLFKVYADLPPTPLPLDLTPRGVAALDAITVNDEVGGMEHPVDLATLTRIFHFSAGITKHLTYRPTARTIPFRAAATTGAHHTYLAYPTLCLAASA